MTIIYRSVPRKRIALAAFAMSLLVATTACSPSTVSSGGATPDVASSNVATPDAATPSPSMTANAPPMSSSEAARVMGECMSEKGWDVITGYDSNRISTTEGQEDAQRRDFEACYHEHGLDRPGPPLNADLAKSEYAAQVRYRDCLIQHGVDAPALPSYEKYEDDLLVQGFIYDLSGEIGMGAEDPLRVTRKDPMNTWGNNG